MSQAWRRLGWLILAVVAGGCAPTHFTVNVKSSEAANQGRPLYMVIRAVDSKQYLSETYSDVAAKVVTPDESVLEATVIYPGEDKQVRLKIPKELPVAISFLFTNPDGAWQALLDVPIPAKVDMELQENRLRTSGGTTPPAVPPPPPKKAEE